MEIDFARLGARGRSLYVSKYTSMFLEYGISKIQKENTIF